MIARLALSTALVLAVPGACMAESLYDAIALAYQTNPQLRAQRAQLRSADANLDQARAAFGPQVSANGQVSYTDARVTQSQFGFTSNTDYRSGNSQADLSATQPIYTSGAATAQARGAEANVLAGRHQLRQAEAQLLVNVVTAYLDVRRDRAISQVIRDEVAALNRASEEIRTKGEVGQLSRTDVAQAQARLLSAQSQFSLALGRLNASNAEYLAVIGQNPGELEPEPELAGVPDKAEVAFDSAEKNNAQLQAAIANERAAREKINQAKAQSGPTVSVRLDAQIIPLEPYLPRQYDRSVSAAVVVNTPIFTSGLNSARIRAAQEDDRRAELVIEATRRDVLQHVSQAWDQLSSTRNAIALQLQEVEQENVAVQGNRLEEGVGLRSVIDLLNSELELVNVRTELLQSRHDEYVARAQLLSAMGLLEAKLLVPGIDAYDPRSTTFSIAGAIAAPFVAGASAIDGIGGQRTSEPLMSAPGAGSARPTTPPVLPPPPPSS